MTLASFRYSGHQEASLLTRDFDFRFLETLLLLWLLLTANGPKFLPVGRLCVCLVLCNSASASLQPCQRLCRVWGQSSKGTRSTQLHSAEQVSSRRCLRCARCAARSQSSLLRNCYSSLVALIIPYHRYVICSCVCESCLPDACMP